MLCNLHNILAAGKQTKICMKSSKQCKTITQLYYGRLKLFLKPMVIFDLHLTFDL